MFNGAEIVNVLETLEFTHVVWVPDSTLGPWEHALSGSRRLKLVRVCREGEAWGVAAGLHLGGKTPLVMIQCTGLFESGDAMRNVVHDYQLPLYAFIGFRSYLSQETLPGDTCLRFTRPILDAWKIDYCFLDEPGKLTLFSEHCLSCRKAEKAGAMLFAEGRA